MERLLRLQADFIIVVLLLICVMNDQYENNQDKKSVHYKHLLITSFVILANKMILKGFEGMDGNLSYVMMQIAGRFMPIGVSVLAYINLLYVRSQISNTQEHLVTLEGGLIFVNIVIILLNLKAIPVFEITAFNIYHKKIAYYFSVFVAHYYFIKTCFFIIKNRNKLVERETQLFFVYTVILLILGVIQMLFPDYKVAYTGMGLLLVVNYIYILNRCIIYDALTGVFNRFCFEQQCERLTVRELKKMVVINIDIDYFKDINDTYGHAEGDIALKTFASLLSKAFIKTGKVFRMGGDEFEILLFSTRPEMAKRYMKKFEELVTYYNKNSKKPYELMFSYGIIYSTPNEQKSIKEILEEADQKMYLQKQQKKKKAFKKELSR